jgi:hypothetical protein
MSEHFTRNTVMASCWCNKCGKPTMHRVDGVKRGPCMTCMEQAPVAAVPKAVVVDQGSLFTDALARDKRGD